METTVYWRSIIMADGGLFATATNSMYPFVGNLAMAGRDTLYSNNIKETQY
jgi:hypothetical protein